MKKIFYTLWGLMSIVLFCACSDDDNPTEASVFNPNEQELVITGGEVTSTSFTFSVQVKDANIPYVCLYVDKKTVDEVNKGDLPLYLMTQLKEQAKEAGMQVEDYIASVAFTGNLDNKKIEGLRPGKLYELVVFAVSGTKIAHKAEYLFFQTLAIDPIECTFDVEVRKNSNQAVLNVAPSVNNVYYYFNVLKKSVYDNYVQSGSYTASDALDALFQSDFQLAMAQFAPSGSLTDETLQQMLDHLFSKGKTSYAVTGLISDTEYIWLASAFKTVEIDDQIIIGSASVISTGVFTSGKKEGNGMTFDIEVTSAGAGSAHIRLIPSMSDQNYLWFHDMLTEENATLTAQELASDYMDTYKDELGNMTVVGIQEKDLTGLTANARYCILAWGFDGSVTTLPVMYEFGVTTDGAVTRTTHPYFPSNYRTLVPNPKLFKVFPVRK